MPEVGQRTKAMYWCIGQLYSEFDRVFSKDAQKISICNKIRSDVHIFLFWHKIFVCSYYHICTGLYDWDQHKSLELSVLSFPPWWISASPGRWIGGNRLIASKFCYGQLCISSFLESIKKVSKHWILLLKLDFVLSKIKLTLPFNFCNHHHQLLDNGASSSRIPCYTSCPVPMVYS